MEELGCTLITGDGGGGMGVFLSRLYIWAPHTDFPAFILTLSLPSSSDVAGASRGVPLLGGDGTARSGRPLSL